MSVTQRVLTRRHAGDPLRCFSLAGPVQPGDVVRDPTGATALVIATETQILSACPETEGQVERIASDDVARISAVEALERAPEIPRLNTVVRTPDGPARVLRIRVRSRTALLATLDGRQIELPLSALERETGDAGPEGEGFC